MAPGAQYARLHRPGVRALAQQAGVVVALDEDRVAGAEGLHQPALQVAKVGSMADGRVAAAEHERQRAGGVVRHGHGPHRDGAHLHLWLGSSAS